MYKVFNMGYLSKEVLDGFDKYKYSSVDTSFVSNYITHPFWNWVVQFYPKWLAPNVLTLVGFFHLLLNFAVLTYYDPKFLASSPDHSEYPPIPDWVWLFCGFNVFMSHTLDGTDGKQARRTGSSSPLGELFDHGLDSWATLFFPTAVYSVFGGGEYGVSPFRVSFVVMGIMFCFILSHWEKYNTGVLFLPWGYDISQIGMVFLFLLTYIGGQSMWHISLSIPGLSGPCSVADIVFILMHIGIYGLTLPPTLWNIYVGYRDKTGKMRGPWEAFRPLVSSFVLFGAMVIWGYKSPSNIIDVNPRLFYWTVGTVFSNIACRLIIAQMSDTRCELMNWMVYPLILIVALVINVPSLNELVIMWVYCMIITIAHIHFGVCVVLEMCEHFNISALTITKLKK